MRLFGIGQALKPYPTNDASAVVNEQLYISPIFTIFFTLEYRSFSPLFTSLLFGVNFEFFPTFTRIIVGGLIYKNDSTQLRAESISRLLIEINHHCYLISNYTTKMLSCKLLITFISTSILSLNNPTTSKSLNGDFSTRSCFVMSPFC